MTVEWSAEDNVNVTAVDIAYSADGGIVWQEIAADLETLTPVCVAGLQDAVEMARELAEEGDTVVLSPACASFDEVNDFADRGDRFRQWAMPRASGRVG